MLILHGMLQAVARCSASICSPATPRCQMSVT